MAAAALLVSAQKERDSVVAAVVEEVPERIVQELRVSVRAYRYLVLRFGDGRAEITTASHGYTGPALQKLSVAGLAFKVCAVDHDPAARKHRLDDAFDLLAFVRVVIDVHVTGLDAERLFLFRIEDHDVGVGADSDRSFLRKQSEHL